MAQSDILMKRNSVSVIGGGGAESEGGREKGDLEVTVGEGKDPSVTLNADRANVTLGGGAGRAPEGDLRLLDRSGDLRIQISAEGGNRPDPAKNRVWIDGGNAEMELSTQRDGEESGVRISADQGKFIDAEINVGGPVLGGSVSGAASIRAYASEDGPAGAASFTDHGRIENAVTIRGDQSLLSLGYSVTKRTVDAGNDLPFAVGGGMDYEVVASENGKIFMEDGSGSTIRVIAKDGKLKIGGDSDADGTYDEDFLVVDTEEKEIYTPWKFVTPDNTYD